MRITGGQARSIPLQCPKGDLVRPATDRMREAVFSSLGDCVKGSRFLDLFAGAGTYGLEAMSRGATSGVFVERDRQAIASLKNNLAAVARSLGIADPVPCGVQQQDVFRWLEASSHAQDQAPNLVFIDPPYREVEGRYPWILSQLARLLPVENPAFIILESPRVLDTFPEGYRLMRTFGKGREDSRCLLLAWNLKETTSAPAQ
jgi:16S rRNA (guanine966-N2)-methyltransferase